MPYILHPALTAWLARNYAGLEGEDRVLPTIVGFLHDVLEDTDARYSTIRQLFGEHIADGVAAMASDKQLVARGASKQEVLQEKIGRLKKQPIWVRVVEPASRYANLLEPGDWSPEKILRYAEDSVWAFEQLDIPPCKLELRLRDQLAIARHAYEQWVRK
jgi:(p)ppGpp synthase/HD superfamily hydrolase